MNPSNDALHHQLAPPALTGTWSQQSSFRSSNSQQQTSTATETDYVRRELFRQQTRRDYSRREFFHVRKFDIVLHHEDGTEYDGTGCFTSCFLGCQKPTYPAGQHITGYLLIRPMRRLIITGVAVTFSGQFVTSWEDGGLKWGSQQVFYRERAVVIENRRIDLDCKWYRFDFEYVLPHGLPTSFKEPEAKLVYLATGSVIQPNGPEIETFDTKFQIRGLVDIDTFPRPWHEPTERRISKTYPVGFYEEDFIHYDLTTSGQVLANRSVVGDFEEDRLTRRSIGGNGYGNGNGNGDSRSSRVDTDLRLSVVENGYAEGADVDRSSRVHGRDSIEYSEVVLYQPTSVSQQDLRMTQGSDTQLPYDSNERTPMQRPQSQGSDMQLSHDPNERTPMQRDQSQGSDTQFNDTNERTPMQRLQSQGSDMQFHDPNERTHMQQRPLSHQSQVQRPNYGAYNEITIAPGLEATVIDIEEEDELVPQLFAILWINSQAFVLGERVTCDVKIENFTRNPVECVLKLEQVLHIQAVVAREDKGRRQPPVYHFRKHRKQTPKDLNILWSTKISAHSCETVSRIFNIPQNLVPTLAQDFRHLPYPGGERLRELAGQRDPGVFIQYFVTLVLTPKWEGAEEIQVPIEIKIGNKDSQTRFTRSLSEGAMTDTTENMERWDVPSCIEDAPPSYEEYIYAKPGSLVLQSPQYIGEEPVEERTIDTGIGVSNHSEDQTHDTSQTSSQSFDAVVSAPFASQDPSPNEEQNGTTALSYDSMFSSGADSLPMFISHLNEHHHNDERVGVGSSGSAIVQQPQSLFQHPQSLQLDDTQPFQPIRDSSLSLSILSPDIDTPTSSAAGPRGPLCKQMHCQQKHVVDLDNLSGHFSDVSLSSPQDSLVGASGLNAAENENGQPVTESSPLVQNTSPL